MTFEEWLERSKICPCGYEAVRCAWKAGQQAECEKRKPLSNDEIRSIMLDNGFTIKDGCKDLKPYVYAAVRAIEKAHGMTRPVPTQKPLSDEEILEVATKSPPVIPWLLQEDVTLGDVRKMAVDFARAIEKAHGIT